MPELVNIFPKNGGVREDNYGTYFTEFHFTLTNRNVSIPAYRREDQHLKMEVAAYGTAACIQPLASPYKPGRDA